VLSGAGGRGGIVVVVVCFGVGVDDGPFVFFGPDAGGTGAGGVGFEWCGGAGGGSGVGLGLSVGLGEAVEGVGGDLVVGRGEWRGRW